MAAGLAPHSALAALSVSAGLLPAAVDGAVDFSAWLIRPQDMLHLRFDFVNLKRVVNSNPPVLDRIIPSRPGYIIVNFDPQNVAEEAFFKSDPSVDGQNPPNDPAPAGDEAPPTPPVESRVAGGSRLAFRVPDSMATVPFTVPSLLTWLQWAPSLSPSALPRGTTAGPAISQPLLTSTAIEAPWRLFLSPDSSGAWVHSEDPVARLNPATSKTRTELWHTRLGVKGGSGESPAVDEGTPADVRAIWATDFNPNSEPPDDPLDQFPFGPPPLVDVGRPSLTRHDRWELVRLTSDYQIPQHNPPVPVQADRFMLTSLGAWMDVRGTWNPPLSAGITVEEWAHRATSGRDNYVRVVYKGFLMPFGHRASLVKVTERKFQPVTAGGSPLTNRMVAYLIQRTYIVVREREKSVPVPGQTAAEARQLPFKKVRITTVVTPDLSNPSVAATGSQLVASPASGARAFWPRVPVGGTPTDFRFHVIAEDWDGERSEFDMPMAWVKGDLAIGSDATFTPTIIRNNYNVAASERRQAALHGQNVAFAASTPGKPGDTTLQASTLDFTVAPPGGAVPNDAAEWMPRLFQAEVRLPAAEHASGSTSPLTPAIQYHPTYISSEFDTSANRGAVWAKLVNQVELGFKADKSGGIVTPNMKIDGLSRLIGPVGGNVNTFVGGQFDPKQFFASIGSKPPSILGGVSLADVIAPVTLSPTVAFAGGKLAAPPPGAVLAAPINLAKVPQITTRAIYPPGANGQEDRGKPPIALETKLVWDPDVQDDPLGIFLTQNVNGTHATLTLTATIVARYDGSAPTFSVSGELANFKARLLGSAAPFITLTFDNLGFISVNGQKPDMDVDISNVEFDGVLEFINQFKDYMGLSDGSGGSGMSDPSNGAMALAKPRGGLLAPMLRPGPAPLAAGETSTGLSVDVDADGITIKAGLALPDIAVGVFSLQNIAFSAGLNIPFIGDPARLRFAFASREAPFRLTYSLFGGGGFLGLALGLDGVEMVEAALEFGANIALDIGVASGGVSVMGGVYFKLTADPESLELTGYIRLAGELDVLGIISVSIEFYLALSYQDPPNELWGQARVTVEIDVLIFSGSVSMTVERRLAGGGSGSASAAATTSMGASAGKLAAPALGPAVQPITFADLVTSNAVWTAYAGAFAA